MNELSKLHVTLLNNAYFEPELNLKLICIGRLMNVVNA